MKGSRKGNSRRVLKVIVGLAWILVGSYLILLNIPTKLMLQIAGYDVALADWYYEENGQGAWTAALQEEGTVQIKRYSPFLAPVLPSNVLSLSDEAVYDLSEADWDIQKGWTDAEIADLEGVSTLTAPFHGVDESGSILHGSIRFCIGAAASGEDAQALWSGIGTTPAGEAFSVWVEILS